MALFPAVNWPALTVSDALAVPPEPERLAAPSDVPPSVKETEPVGAMLPVAAFTVAVSVVLPLGRMLVGLAVTVVVVPTAGALDHCVTRLYASTEPKPVARSYPEPAL